MQLKKKNDLIPDDNSNELFFEKLNKSIDDVANGKDVTFSMEELNEFISK